MEFKQLRASLFTISIVKFSEIAKHIPAETKGNLYSSVKYPFDSHFTTTFVLV